MTAISKTSIDQLGERLRRGNVTEHDLRLLDSYRRSFSPSYEAVIATIRRTLGLDPTGRPAKSTSSIVEKLHRETIRLTQMQDIAGCRVVVADTDAQDEAVQSLSAAFPGAEAIDRRLNPSHGYRAVHLIARIEGKPIEIQVRTILQHAWAELSEKLSDVIDPAIKYGGGPPDVKKLLEDYVDLVKAIEEAETDPRKKAKAAELRDRVRQSLENATRAWSKPN